MSAYSTKAVIIYRLIFRTLLRILTGYFELSKAGTKAFWYAKENLSF